MSTSSSPSLQHLLSGEQYNRSASSGVSFPTHTDQRGYSNHPQREHHASGDMVGRQHHMEGGASGGKWGGQQSEESKKRDRAARLAAEDAAQKAAAANKGKKVFTEAAEKGHAVAGVHAQEMQHALEKGHQPEKPKELSPLSQRRTEYFKKVPAVAGAGQTKGLKAKEEVIDQDRYTQLVNKQGYKPREVPQRLGPQDIQKYNTEHEGLRQRIAAKTAELRQGRQKKAVALRQKGKSFNDKYFPQGKIREGGRSVSPSDASLERAGLNDEAEKAGRQEREGLLARSKHIQRGLSDRGLTVHSNDYEDIE